MHPSAIVVIDTETTGFGGKNCCVVELGAVAFDADGNELGAFGSLVRINPDVDLDNSQVRKAFEITGIDPQATLKAPQPWDVWDAFCAWGKPYRAFSVTAFNVPFDRRMMEAAPYFAPLPWADFCIMQMVKRHSTSIGVKGNRLTTVAERFGIVPDGPAHRAVTDARTAGRVYFALVAAGVQ